MSLVSSRAVAKTLKSYASTDKAKNLSRFFKTGKGQYGEGDKFMGIVVPDVRKVAKEYYKQVSLNTIEQLIKSPYHEVRLCALIMLVYQYQRAQSLELRSEIYNFYLSHTKYINNWDLVDLTAPNIVGDFLLNELLLKIPPLRFPSLVKEGKQGRLSTEELPIYSPFAIRHLPILYSLSHSQSLWERRIAILATFSYIRAGRNQEAFAIAEILLYDKHDLIHKAVGWMLREVGKRIGKDTLREFLDKHADTMPRTALRYAIEHLSEQERKHYLLMKSI